jgi:hypothetical protein
MKNLPIFKLICISFFFFVFTQYPSDAVQPTDLPRRNPAVKVEGRKLLVDFDGDGRYIPYLVKGVGYQPTPIGEMYNIPEDPKVLERDFSLLEKMGCNTIRTWGSVHKPLLDCAYKHGIKVIAGFKPYNDDVELSHTRNRIRIINQFKDYVSTYKDHPAILFWAIGNEDNYHYRGRDIKDWYVMANEMAREARRIERKSYHPVAIVNGHLNNIGDRGKRANDESMKYIEIWGVNVYIGYSFENSAMGNFFGQYAMRSKKPLWISEYGIDAWDNVNKREHQDEQAEWVGNNWEDIAKTSVCIGSTLMAYSDEWCKSGNPSSHDFGGYDTLVWGNLHPDDFSNEEWWGIVSVEKTNDGIDKVTPRKVYYTLMEKWSKPYDLEAKYSRPEPGILNLEPLKKKGILKVTSSSNQGGTLGPEAALDSNISTRWESQQGVDPAWIQIELEKKKLIKGLKISWETASAQEYKVQLSQDGIKWTAMADIIDGKKAEEKVINFKPTETRFIRINGTKRTTKYGYSIWEIEFNPGEGFPDKKPLSNGPVKVDGRQLLLGGKPFFIKGVGYQPTPAGYDIDEYDIFSNADIYNRDFKLLREMNCNTIRTWAKVTSKEFLDAAYNNGEKPIYVIMGFWVNPYTLDYSNPIHREKVIEEFKNYVNEFKDHPAVLMWALGNEQDSWYQRDISPWYTLVNDMAKAAFKIEGENYHPVTSPNGSLDNIGDVSSNADDNSMNYLDLWGANVYMGDSFGDLFSKYQKKSKKPFWISEYGVPAWDYIKRGDENITGDPKTLDLFSMQSYIAGKLWDEMVANSDICCGGTLMAYSDEWWKAGNPPIHDTAQDGVEWYGVMAIEKKGDGPDVMHPRKVYYTLQEKWSKSILEER